MGHILRLSIPSCQWNHNRLWFYMMNTAPNYNKTPKGRIKRDSHHETENTLLAVLLRFGAFKAYDPQTLQTFADKEWVTQAIGMDLLTAEEKNTRSIGHVCGQKIVAIRREERAVFRAELPQNNIWLMYPWSKCSSLTHGQGKNMLLVVPLFW